MSQIAKRGATRKSLRTLQRSDNEPENLVGRPNKSLKQVSRPASTNVKGKRQVVKKQSKSIQVDLESQVSVQDLTDPDGASEHYWKIRSQQQQTTLNTVLEEKEKLLKTIEDLKEENALLKQMLGEANSFIEVIKEELGNTSNNDTGIDVNDVSTADEAAE